MLDEELEPMVTRIVRRLVKPMVITTVKQEIVPAAEDIFRRVVSFAFFLLYPVAYAFVYLLLSVVVQFRKMDGYWLKKRIAFLPMLVEEIASFLIA